MGTEIGQFDEWDSNSSVQWDLLSYDKHRQLQFFFKEINKFYLENKPLYELDTIWKGFDWIHHDDYTNSVIAFKRTDSEGNDIIAVCNFQTNMQQNYNIGVPKYGLYDEIFNSDKEEYGGTGVTNGKEILPEIRKIHGCNQGLSLTLPPLSVIYLRCTQELEFPKPDSSEEK
jgi:1,4-alpha-glucan branching enzyme